MPGAASKVRSLATKKCVLCPELLRRQAAWKSEGFYKCEAFYKSTGFCNLRLSLINPDGAGDTGCVIIKDCHSPGYFEGETTGNLPFSINNL